MNAATHHCLVHANGAMMLLGRVVDPVTGEALVPSDLAAIRYAVYAVPDYDSSGRTVVTGHDDVAMVVADVIHSTLQTGYPWDDEADAIGYNFRATIYDAANAAFPVVGQKYLVIVTFERTGQPPIMAQWGPTAT